MDASAERQATENAVRHAAEFRRKHRISDAEWKHAEEMHTSMKSRLLRAFWDAYNQNPQLWADTQKESR
jgi:hypothetical protein